MASPAVVFCTVATCIVYLSAAKHSQILELETHIQTLVKDSKNVRAVDTALDATSSGSPVHCLVPDEPV